MMNTILKILFLLVAGFAVVWLFIASLPMIQSFPMLIVVETIAFAAILYIIDVLIELSFSYKI